MIGRAQAGRFGAMLDRPENLYGGQSHGTDFALLSGWAGRTFPDKVGLLFEQRAVFVRGPLWEGDRGADKVAFGKLDAAMTQNIVSGGVMKIEVG